MKLILGNAGSGKTNMVAEEASKLGNNGVEYLILSDEVSPVDYLDKMNLTDDGIMYGTIRHHRRISLPSLVAMILEDKTNNHIFIDITLSLSEKDLDFLMRVEEYTGKTLYVAVQTNLDSKLKVAKIIEGADLNGTTIH